MQSPPQPVSCPACQEIFLPGPANLVQCPYCSTISHIHKCLPATAPAMELPEGAQPWVSEEEVKRAQLRSAQARNLKIILALSTLAAIPAGYYLMKAVQTKQANTAQSEAALRQQSISSAEAAARAAAEQAASEAFSAPDVAALAACVRDAQRVKPLIEWYYATAPGGYAPRPIQEIRDVEALVLGGKNSYKMEAVLPDGASVYFLMVEGTRGWKLDWESYVAVHDTRWKLFLRGELPAPAQLQVHAARMPLGSLTDVYLSKLGMKSADLGTALRFWVADREDKFAVAVFAKDSPLATELMGEAEWDQTVRVTVEASLRSAEVDPPMLEILKLTGKGWPIDESTE